MTKWFAFSLILLLPMIPNVGFGQDQKQEVEKKIQAAEMPESALSLLKPYLKTATRIKYYKETDIDHESYECKLKFEGLRFSIEFEPQGRLEDIEVLVSIENVASEAHDKILEYLQQFRRFRVRRVQLQFKPDSTTDARFIDEIVKARNLKSPNHEIVVDIKDESGWSTFEMLFDHSGVFLSQRMVIGRQTDNILYR